MDTPIFLKPVFTHNIWGGTRLNKDFGYDIEGKDIGECWGIAAHPNGDCVVLGGQYDGCRLSVLYDEHRELFGNIDSKVFPLLVKIIDAQDDLSIQVHPDDEYAGVYENGSLGKTECWYILDCDKDASLVIGHNASTHEELCSMVNEGRWNDLIRKIKIAPGDFIQIDPGTVHAITAGCLILETQQNSDITYRVYDYDRLQNGALRPLHVKQSLDVITVPAQDAQKSLLKPETDKAGLSSIFCNDFYEIMLLNTIEEYVFCNKYPFVNCSVIEGKGQVCGVDIEKGSHFIIPSGLDKAYFQGKMKIIMSAIAS